MKWKAPLKGYILGENVLIISEILFGNNYMENKDGVKFLHNQFISLIYPDSENLLVSTDELKVQKKKRNLIIN